MLSTPPAFILSQDQTLRNYSQSLSSSQDQIARVYWIDRFVCLYHSSVVNVLTSLTYSLPTTSHLLCFYICLHLLQPRGQLSQPTTLLTHPSAPLKRTQRHHQISLVRNRLHLMHLSSAFSCFGCAISLWAGTCCISLHQCCPPWGNEKSFVGTRREYTIAFFACQVWILLIVLSTVWLFYPHCIPSNLDTIHPYTNFRMISHLFIFSMCVLPLASLYFFFVLLFALVIEEVWQPLLTAEAEYTMWLKGSSNQLKSKFQYHSQSLISQDFTVGIALIIYITYTQLIR